MEDEILTLEEIAWETGISVSDQLETMRKDAEIVEVVPGRWLPTHYGIQTGALVFSADRNAGPVLVSERAFLFAEVRQERGVRTLYVRRSVVVQDDDCWMRPITQYLAGTCHVLGSSTVVDDETVMFGQAEKTIYRLFDECPATAAEHNCRLRPDSSRGGGDRRTGR